jgi:hypothetical protein
VQQIVPEVVMQVDEDKLSIAYGNLVALLIEAIKELNSKMSGK